MTSIEDKLRELGIDPGWRLCQEMGLRRLKCWQDETEEWCPAYKPGVACHGSIIARLIDMVEGMRCCQNCDYYGSPPLLDPCHSCGNDYSNWRYRGLP